MMRISSLTINNFRGIRHAQLQDLSNFVIIAGENGVGKSTIFDAIRLLKSYYGGSGNNEQTRWFQEFQIDPNRPSTFLRLFHDPEKKILIEASVNFTNEELESIKNCPPSVVAPFAFTQATGLPVDNQNFNPSFLAQTYHSHQHQIEDAARRIMSELGSQCESSEHTLHLEIHPDGVLKIRPSTVVSIAFSTEGTLPHIGTIEYHSAGRTYQRQGLSSISLDTASFKQQERQNRLYDWQSKYQNIKGELIADHLLSIMPGDEDGHPEYRSLNADVEDLFSTFFPNKSYRGPAISRTREVSLPVRTLTGKQHDIDELSSGEKEVLYGFVRIRNSTPKNSIVLIDEPELHLHPRILESFTDFYERHITQNRSSQVWIVTHSDALLRSSIGDDRYSIYHLCAIDTESVNDAEYNQAIEVNAEDSITDLIVALSGSPTLYQPHGKVVILEGDPDYGQFDVNVVSRLFPKFASSVNLVSGGHKNRVRDTHRLLQEIGATLSHRNSFYAVMDRDFTTNLELPENTFVWDRYHIENYLLEPEYIAAAVSTCLGENRNPATEEGHLKRIAEGLVPKIALIKYRTAVNDEVVRCLSWEFDPKSKDIPAAMSSAIERSFVKLADVKSRFDLSYLQKMYTDLVSDLQQSILDGDWVKKLPARLILKEYAQLNNLHYRTLVNVILDHMTRREFKPQSMAQVLEEISPGSTR
ncbi:AAA family ATPase [Rhodococcus ruber]|uniref:AAA family ATPase n=1 Tax=Rhodococcus ruber TaxID=1830 RepID=UPI00177AF910|nr:ATP-binding protein [Rhodococcus ruber]MBD8055305.1 AAA family ATPase [Rhodococcus ruber]